MWRPSLSNVGKLTVAGVLLLASAEAEACLFPCLWGWGGCWSPQQDEQLEQQAVGP